MLIRKGAEMDEIDPTDARHPGPPPNDRQRPVPAPDSDFDPYSDPDPDPDPDPEWMEYVAWVDREAAVGRDSEPEFWDPEPEFWDPEEEDGPVAVVRRLFDQGGTGDQLPPGPVLTGLTDNATAELTRMSDDELIGVLRAARRQVAR